MNMRNFPWRGAAAALLFASLPLWCRDLYILSVATSIGIFVIAAISLSVPTYRFTEERPVFEQRIAAVARRISERLGHVATRDTARAA